MEQDNPMLNINDKSIKFYTYGNIVRILRHDAVVFANSLMVDVDMDKGAVLTVFDASKPFDAAFIQSFINLLDNSKTGFSVTSDPEIQSHALDFAKSNGINI